MDNPNSTPQGNHDIKHSHNSTAVEMSGESCQASGRSGSSKNESPAIPFVSEEHVSVSSERSVGCNEGSASTTGISEKDGNVKPIKGALSASQCKRKCSWGLIWRKKKLESNTCEDSILRKIILKGSPDMSSLKPTCHYCSQPYDSDLMYIQCETCPSWYHADAVGLEEKRISDLVGFKCCKCRKIRKPACPYSAPEVKKLQVEASKVENMDVQRSCPGSVQEQDLLPKSADEAACAAHDHPLPVSSSQVRPQSENSQQRYHERNTAIDSGPQKLPVRRCVKHEKDENPFTADGSGNAGLSTCSKS